MSSSATLFTMQPPKICTIGNSAGLLKNMLHDADYSLGGAIAAHNQNDRRRPSQQLRARSSYTFAPPKKSACRDKRGTVVIFMVYGFCFLFCFMSTYAASSRRRRMVERTVTAAAVLQSTRLRNKTRGVRRKKGRTRGCKHRQQWSCGRQSTTRYRRPDGARCPRIENYRRFE